MSNDLPLVAGIASTVIFVASYLPMLVKAVHTKDLTSYSPTNLLLVNLGNAVHSVYVYSLPMGPIWALHSFYVATSALMLFWYLRYTRRARRHERMIRNVPSTIHGQAAKENESLHRSNDWIPRRARRPAVGRRLVGRASAAQLRSK